MPNRRLPERSRSRQQLDERILRRIRFLERRVRYPGKQRSVQFNPGSSYFPITLPANQFVYASLDLVPGRWKIESSSNIEADGILGLEIQVFGYDHNGDPTTEQNDNQQLGFGQWFADTGTIFDLTISTLGVGVFDHGGRIDLAITAASPFTPSLAVGTSWLFATPI